MKATLTTFLFFECRPGIRGRDEQGVLAKTVRAVELSITFMPLVLNASEKATKHLEQLGHAVMVAVGRAFRHLATVKSASLRGWFINLNKRGLNKIILIQGGLRIA